MFWSSRTIECCEGLVERVFIILDRRRRLHMKLTMRTDGRLNASVCVVVSEVLLAFKDRFDQLVRQLGSKLVVYEPSNADVAGQQRFHPSHLAVAAPT